MSGSKEYAKRIPDSEWDLHERTIRRLYIQEAKPLTAPGGVQEIMFRDFEFSATKSQYETRFEKWGLRTYKSSYKRRDHAKKLRSRRANGRKTERHVRNLADNDTSSGVSSHSPNSAIECLPPGRLLRQHSSLNLLSPTSPPLIWTGGRQTFPLSSTSHATMPSLTNTQYADLFPLQDHAWTSNTDIDANDSFYSVLQTSNDVSTALRTSRYIHDSQSPDLTRISASSSYEKTLSTSNGWNDLAPWNSNSFGVAPPSGATITFEKFSTLDFVESVLPMISLMFPRVGSYASMVSIVDRGILESAIRKISHPSALELIRQQRFDHQLIYFIFYRLVNGDDAVLALDNPKTKLDLFLRLGVKYCFSFGEVVVDNIISSFPSTYRKALIQNLFHTALSLGDAPILNAILKRDEGDLANRPVRLGASGLEYIPMKFTVREGHLKMSQVLINHGAHSHPDCCLVLPSRNHEESSIREWTSMEMVELTRLVMGRGWDVHLESAVRSIHDGDKHELLLLATLCLDKSFHNFFIERALPVFLSRPEWDDSFSTTLEAIIDRASPDRIKHQHTWNRVLSLSLLTAVVHSNTSAFDILLAKGAKADIDCLVCAVQTKDTKIFEDLLNQGLNPFAEGCRSFIGADSQSFGKYGRTAMVASIRAPFRGAFHILKSRGFISKLAHEPQVLRLALLAACEVSDSTLVEQLLSLRMHSQDDAEDGETLEAAIEGKQYHFVDRLIWAGFKPSMKCLVLACRNKRFEAFKQLAILMKPTMSRRHSPYNSNSVLFEVLRWGNHEALDLVIRMDYPLNSLTCPDSREDWTMYRDLRPDVVEGWGWTPLSVAILQGNPTSVKTLMDYGAEVSYYTSHLTSHHLDTLKETMTHDEILNDLTGWVMTPLAACIVKYDVAKIQEFLSKGADPFDNSAFFACVVLDLEDIAAWLLTAFKDRYPYGSRSFCSDALYQAMRRKNTRMFSLLAKDADLIGRIIPDRTPEERMMRSFDVKRPMMSSFNVDFTSPLGVAVRLYSVSEGSDGILDTLLPLVKDVNAVVCGSSMFGLMTCVHYGASLGSVETVKKLHQTGANISLSAERGFLRTPLQIAVQAESLEVVEYLLHQGVDPNESPAPRAGATALQLAAIAGDMSIATALVDAGAKVNAPRALVDGRSAFEGATEHGRIEMMLFLVHHGADLLANNNEQYLRAIHFAKKSSQHAARELADELYANAVANHGTSFTGEGTIEWAGFALSDFEESFSQAAEL